jgi:hypothetical protein
MGGPVDILLLTWDRPYMLGGIKKQSTFLFPNASYGMHMCMRLSFDSRADKVGGIIAVPNFEVPRSCGGPPLLGISQMAASTGAQSTS